MVKRGTLKPKRDMLSNELSRIRADYAISKRAALHRVRTLPRTECVLRRGPASLWQTASEVIIRMDATGLEPLFETPETSEFASRILYELARAYHALAAQREVSPIYSINDAVTAMRAAGEAIRGLRLPWDIHSEYMAVYRLNGDIISRIFRIFVDTPYGKLSASLELTANLLE